MLFGNKLHSIYERFIYKNQVINVQIVLTNEEILYSQPYT